MTFGKFWMVSMRLMPVERPPMILDPSVLPRLPSIVPTALPLSMSPNEVLNSPPASLPRPFSSFFTALVNLFMEGMTVM